MSSHPRRHKSSRVNVKSVTLVYSPQSALAKDLLTEEGSLTHAFECAEVSTASVRCHTLKTKIYATLSRLLRYFKNFPGDPRILCAQVNTVTNKRGQEQTGFNICNTVATGNPKTKILSTLLIQQTEKQKFQGLIYVLVAFLKTWG